MPSASLNLLTIAHQTMIDAGFKPDVPEPVLQELNNLKLGGHREPATRDLRALLWSSIDDSKSRDLDQVEYAERLPNGGCQVRQTPQNVPRVGCRSAG
jgi:exoribonuclease-2